MRIFEVCFGFDLVCLCGGDMFDFVGVVELKWFG